MEFLKRIMRGDGTVWTIFLIMLVCSGIVMYSASSTLAYRAQTYYNPISSHITHLIMGFLVALIVHNIPLRYIRGVARMMFPWVVIVVLAAVSFMPQVNGAARSMMGIQPSEPARLLTVAALAYFLSRYRNEDGTYPPKALYTYLGYCALVVGLILKENLSTAGLLIAVIVTMLIIARIKWGQVKYIVYGGGVLAVLFFSFLLLMPADKLPGRFPTWRARIERSREDLRTAPITDENMQAQYGYMAVANGGVTGVFAGRSQIRDFLPQAFSDFIYSIIFEEYGLAGGIATILIYLALMWRSYRIYQRCQMEYPRLLLVGVTFLIIYQALMSMSVGVGIILTGQPLPLISRGGSSIIITSAYIGIILSISRLDSPEEGPEWQTSRSVAEQMRRELAEQENNQIEQSL